MTVKEYIAAKVAEAPPLSERQRAQFALLFAPYRKAARARLAGRRAS